MFLTAALLLIMSASASAGLIYSNGNPDTNNVSSRGMTIFRVADDFTLGAGATVASVRFWMVAEPGNFSGSITYAVYQDLGGALGSVVNTGTVSNIAPLLLNAIPGNIHSVYLVDFNLPALLALGAGTYWLELHDGSSLSTANNPNTPNVLWAIVPGVIGNAKQNAIPTLPSSNTGNALAFELFDAGASGVPEPGTVLTSLFGLVGLGFASQRKG